MLLTYLHLQKLSLGVVKMYHIQSRIRLSITYKFECIPCESYDLNICTYSKNSNRSSKNTQEQVVKVNLTVEADVQYWTDCKSPAASSYTILYKFTLFCCCTSNLTKLSTLFILYKYHVWYFYFPGYDTEHTKKKFTNLTSATI